MGMFVNPDNSAFQAALNAQIYVDKSGLLVYTNRVLASTDAFICNSPAVMGRQLVLPFKDCVYLVFPGCHALDSS